MDPASFGFFISFVGLCFAVVNGAVVPYLVTRLSASTIMVGGLLVLAAGRATIGAAQTVPVLMVGDVLVALGGCRHSIPYANPLG